MKAKSFCEGLHGHILLQDIGDDAVQFLVSRDLNEPAQQFGAQAAMLIEIAHEHGDFSLFPAVQFAQTPDRNDPMLSRVCVSVVGHQRHLPVVVDEAHADETLVRDARIQAEEVEVSQVDALLGPAPEIFQMQRRSSAKSCRRGHPLAALPEYAA